MKTSYRNHAIYEGLSIDDVALESTFRVLDRGTGKSVAVPEET